MTGYALCGSFCTHKASLKFLEAMSREREILPILSDASYSTDTRFGTAEQLRKRILEITGREIVHTIKDAEPIGPTLALDALVIAPCTGNTLAKIAHGITDTPVTMAAKAHLRSGRILVIALATNDAMSANLENIALLLNRKNVYFVPMIQDDTENKPNSLVADFSKAEETLTLALTGTQIRPLFLESK